MKKLLPLLGLSLLLAACDSGPQTPTPNDPAITQIKGVVGSGTGSGTIELRSGTSVLSSAAVAATGAFTLPLPSADKFSNQMVTADSVLGQVGCTGTLTSSTPGTKGFGFAELLATRSGATLPVVNLNADLKLLALPPRVDFNGHAWVYTDKATLLQGNVDCTSLINAPTIVNKLTVSVNAQTRAGWNVVEITGSTSGLSLPTAASASATTVKDIEGSNWRTVSDIGKSITSLSLQGQQSVK